MHGVGVLNDSATWRAEGRDLLVAVTDRSGEDDRIFTSDDKLDRELLDLLWSMPNNNTPV